MARAREASMNAWRSLMVVSILMTVAAVCVILWQKRNSSTSPAAGAAMSDVNSIPNLYPGGAPPAGLSYPKSNIHEELSGYDVSEGKRLYHWMNCVGCHNEGGGGIGPALT